MFVLARISHQLSTAAADPSMPAALRSFGLFDILSRLPAGPSEVYIFTLGAKRQALEFIHFSHLALRWKLCREAAESYSPGLAVFLQPTLGKDAVPFYPSMRTARVKLLKQVWLLF